MLGLCDYLPKKGLGTGRDGHSDGRVCQLGPGLFAHRELEQHLNDGATRVAPVS